MQHFILINSDYLASNLRTIVIIYLITKNINIS